MMPTSVFAHLLLSQARTPAVKKNIFTHLNKKVIILLSLSPQEHRKREHIQRIAAIAAFTS